MSTVYIQNSVCKFTKKLNITTKFNIFFKTNFLVRKEIFKGLTVLYGGTKTKAVPKDCFYYIENLKLLIAYNLTYATNISLRTVSSPSNLASVT